MRWARASMRSARRAASETLAPARAHATAVASPMPEEAPVTATTCRERSAVIRRAYLAALRYPAPLPMHPAERSRESFWPFPGYEHFPPLQPITLALGGQVANTECRSTARSKRRQG